MTEDELNAIADRADARAYENGAVEDSFEACASDLRQSVKHDALSQIPACIMAVADRIDALRAMQPLTDQQCAELSRDLFTVYENMTPEESLAMFDNTPDAVRTRDAFMERRNEVIRSAFGHPLIKPNEPSPLDRAVFALNAVVAATSAHLEPNGPSAADTIKAIIEATDPWPLKSAGPGAPRRDFFAVVTAAGTEGVVFTDEADARWTAGRGRRKLVYSTLGESFRDTYDEQDKFELIRLQEVL